MGVVYAAYDPELDRRVALKLVSPAVAGTRDESQGQARLLREAQAMARLSHPNVMPVYDVGTFGDQVFIAMEYVEGSTLAEWLAEPKRPWREIVSMFVQAGRGLAAAHAGGLLHRDFKPNNVLVGKDGRARVLDFGLARPAQPDKSAERSAADGRAPAYTKSTPRLAMLGVTVTQRGKFVGTPAYMAPEQLMGGRADERTDQYSFCVALYQGLYGDLPFNAENLGSLLELVRQRRVKEAPSATSVPSWLRQILLRGLNPNPAERYSSMEVLLNELVRHRALPRRRSVILASLILLMAVAGATRMVLERKNTAKGIQSIAVLPLENLTGDASQEAVVDGFTAALNQNLADLSTASVISRDSSIRYKATKKPVSEIGKELDVDGVVRGWVKHSGSRFQVGVELIHAATGRQLWAKSYEREPQETVVLQADVAADLVGEVESKIKPERQARLAKLRSVKPEVYQAYLTGRFFLNKRNEADLRRSIAYFEQALREDVQYAPAYVGLAEAYFFLAHPASVLVPKEASRLATAAAKKALSLDPTLGEAHAILAFVKDHLDWDWRSAEQEYKRALELNPNHAMAHKWYSGYLANTGRRMRPWLRPSVPSGWIYSRRTRSLLSPTGLPPQGNMTRPSKSIRKRSCSTRTMARCAGTFQGYITPPVCIRRLWRRRRKLLKCRKIRGIEPRSLTTWRTLAGRQRPRRFLLTSKIA